MMLKLKAKLCMCVCYSYKSATRVVCCASQSHCADLNWSWAAWQVAPSPPSPPPQALSDSWTAAPDLHSPHRFLPPHRPPPHLMETSIEQTISGLITKAKRNRIHINLF